MAMTPEEASINRVTVWNLAHKDPERCHALKDSLAQCVLTEVVRTASYHPDDPEWERVGKIAAIAIEANAIPDRWQATA